MTIALDMVEKAKMRLLTSEPFFGGVLIRTPLIEVPVDHPDVDTMATDMHNIYFNPQCVHELTAAQRIFALLHEVLHIVFKHGYRRGTRDPKLWNIACDYWINSWLRAAGYEWIEWGCYNPKYDHINWTEEQIYEDLRENAEAQPEPQPGQGNGDGDLLPTPEDGCSAEGQKRQREIDAIVAGAAQMAKIAGKMSSDLERVVSDVLDPPLPWYAILEDYMNEVIEDDVDWGRRNARMPVTYMPVNRSQDAMGAMVGIGDCSGSLSDDIVSMIAANARDCGEVLMPETFHWIWATKEVVSEQTFERGEEIVLANPGTGGTDMRVPLKHAEQYDPDVVVLITDGHTPWPDHEPPYPLIVVCTTDVDVPIGRVVRYAA